MQQVTQGSQVPAPHLILDESLDLALRQIPAHEDLSGLPHVLGSGLREHIPIVDGVVLRVPGAVRLLQQHRDHTVEPCGQ